MNVLFVSKINYNIFIFYVKYRKKYHTMLLIQSDYIL